MDFGLNGKTAIVAGGSRGIGKAIAWELAREGVDLALTARTLGPLEETAKEETGRKVVAFACDVLNRKAVDETVNQAADALGGLNILINSAVAPGGSPGAVGRIETIVDEDFLSDFDTKYMGALRLTRAAIPHFKKAGWGRIITISGSTPVRRAI